MKSNTHKHTHRARARNDGKLKKIVDKFTENHFNSFHLNWFQRFYARVQPHWRIHPEKKTHVRAKFRSNVELIHRPKKRFIRLRARSSSLPCIFSYKSKYISSDDYHLGKKKTMCESERSASNAVLFEIMVYVSSKSKSKMSKEWRSTAEVKFHIEQLDAPQPQYFTLNFRFGKNEAAIRSARPFIYGSIFPTGWNWKQPQRHNI